MLNQSKELFEDQIAIEQTFSKGFIRHILDAELDDEFIIEYFGDDEQDMTEGYAICKALIDKGNNAGILLQNMVASMMRYLGYEYNADELIKAMDILEKWEECGLYSFEHRSAETFLVHSHIELDSDTSEDLAARCYLPPMLVRPDKWTDNRNGGYITVESKKHAVLKKMNKHNDYLNLSALNKLQETPLKIDEFVATKVKEYDYKDRYDKQSQDVVTKSYLDAAAIYFVWRFDKRGRMYAQGWQVSPQGKSYKKALLSLAEAEPLTPRGEYWMKIGIANALGYDKENWDYRLEKAEEYLEIVGAGMDPYNISDHVISCVMPSAKEYDDAYQLAKLTYAWFQWIHWKKPVDCTVSLDSTASGVQIMGVVAGCEYTSYYANLTDNTKRLDPYFELFEYMLEEYDCEPVPRKVAKECLITHIYNSVATPRDKLTPEQLQVFYMAVDELFPAVRYILDVINYSVWDNRPLFTWNLWDDHTAYVPVFTKREEFFDFQGFEFEYKYKEEGPSGNHRHLAPNIIHSIDAWVARQMVLRCDFAVIPNHDCFSVHPNNCDKIREVYTGLMHELNNGNILDDIFKQLTNGKVGFKKMSKGIHIIDDNYAIC